jgi:hypothetical protein
MHENILSTVIGLDETESLGCVKPLHNARRHVRLPVEPEYSLGRPPWG